MPMLSTTSNSRHIAASAFSVSVRGPTTSCAGWMFSCASAGRARRSTLPLDVSGNLSNRMKYVGSM